LKAEVVEASKYRNLLTGIAVALGLATLVNGLLGFLAVALRTIVPLIVWVMGGSPMAAVRQLPSPQLFGRL
jgi:hypothetical protein